MGKRTLKESYKVASDYTLSLEELNQLCDGLTKYFGNIFAIYSGTLFIPAGNVCNIREINLFKNGFMFGKNY
jgi:hypothetical protein